jgi:hypothetical protein
MARRGRPENLKRGRKKGDPPTRKLSEQKVTEFCLHYLTHGEALRATALHMGMALTYVYEFFQKPAVQDKLKELRARLDEEMLQKALDQKIATPQFIDEHLAPIIANRRPHPSRGFQDQIAAARLAAEIGGLIEKGKPQVQQSAFITAQFVQKNSVGSQVYTPLFDRQRKGIHDPQSEEVERELLGSGEEEVVAVDAKNKGSAAGTE